MQQPEHPTPIPGLPGQNTPASETPMAPKMPAPAPAEEPAALEIPLSKPVISYGNEVDTIRLRQPNFGDWLDCGELQETILHDVDQDSFNSGDKSHKIEVRTNPEATIKWFTRLSGMRADVLRKISIGDFRRLFAGVQQLVGDVDQGNLPA